ncbi:epithelial splicing regulatory protein 2 isoform X2 [Lingula anatina]|uniref:Epithelial splicing regulatory protein 2 isoform X2 n=1 Tax=Lingula anatina TaxID=7574 RepID=A0A1S3I1D3_LINAN|nr:epithelial splicing regulatory protein 2 isoform X2 [Lingula anatina]|eukprot:XP_013391159.1 epithelial splicing regulatory protein 2 isoform X2 [Lingula anatina]
MVQNCPHVAVAHHNTQHREPRSETVVKRQEELEKFGGGRHGDIVRDAAPLSTHVAATHRQIMACNYLVVIFCATAGKQGEELGTDEEQIVLIVYLLLDISNNRVVSLQHQYVRPQVDDISETVLTEECKTEIDLNEDSIRNAQPLEQVLDEFDRFIKTKGCHPESGGNSFTFVCDGQLHFRLSLHPEACNKNITLPDYFYRFYDLRKEFKTFYKTENINGIKDMLEYLGLEGDQSVDYGVRQCQEMSSIITRLINDGHTFTDPDIIKDRLEPGICNKTEFVDDDTVIRARGLPWQSSDQDIAKFFRGLNIAKGGVALCLSQQGRRNGEALIRFENKEHRDLALKKHKHHLGQRYIEVYKASGKDFINVAGGNNTEAQAFLSRGGQVIIRMRGLPYSCTTEQVLDFFRRGENAVEVLDGEEGILFVHQADGRATGDAFVLFATEEASNTALLKHRELIGTRYIELFKSTTAEVQQVLNRSMDPRSPQEPDIPLPPLIASLPQSLPFLPQQAITCGVLKDCTRMRGLPYEATVTDILNFLGEHSRNIVFQGVHMVYNAQGQPTGEAFIQMDNELSAEACAASRHKKYMIHGNKKRYIEVFQCSGEDMNMVLTNGALPPPPNPAAAAAAAVAATAPVTPTLHALPTPQTIPQLARHPVHQLQPSSAAAMLATGGLGQIAFSSAPILPQTTLSPASPYTAAYPYPTAATATALPQATPFAAHSMTSPFVAPSLTHIPAARPAATNPYYPPILYWYPSPPVSPQTYYAHSGPSVVVMRGLPYNATVQDILNFFEGFYEVTPECIQIQRNTDGRPNGDALVTFVSRNEAERAITERNRKIIGNRYIELFMA